MQDNSLEQSTSISHLLRESYSTDSRAQRHREMSHPDGARHPLVYGTFTTKPEEMGGQDDFLDLSAFLSQEELDKSVNLARQAIGHTPQEDGTEEQASSNPPKTRPSLEKKEVAQPQPPLDRQAFQTATKENVLKSNKTRKEPIQDFRKPVRNTPYGPETQSKKEFLNKAADFIEELSSLFKANSSKRIRPRSCKAHRSRYQAKGQQEGADFTLSTDGRERPVPTYTGQPHVETDLCLQGDGTTLLKDGAEEMECDVGLVESCEVKGKALPLPQQLQEPVMEPPRFIQKLKSREVPEGSKVQLDCIVSGVPPPEVRWFCEGKELENSPDIQIINNGERHSLIIAEAFEEDTGRYSCFASNFYGTDSTSAEIYIEGASSSDSDGGHNFEHVTQTQKKTSQSKSAGPPASRAPKAYVEDPLSVPSAVTPKGVQLPVQEVSTPSTTQVVTAQTPLQEVNQQPEDFQSQNAVNYPHPQGLDGSLLMAAPVFTKNLQDIIAFEGQLVVLECRVKGIPSPRVEWYREGTLVDDSPDFRILQKKEICTLVIAEVFPEDSGTFTCTAKNKYGTVSSIAYLKVKGNENNRFNTKVGTNFAAEPSQVFLDPTNSRIKPQAEGTLSSHNKLLLNSVPLDSPGFAMKPTAEAALVRQNESRPAVVVIDPYAPYPKPSLEHGLAHHNESLPKMEGVSVHNESVPRLETSLLNHNQSLLRLEGSAVNHKEPLPSSVPSDSFSSSLNSKSERVSGILPHESFHQESLIYPSEVMSTNIHSGLKLEGNQVNLKTPMSSVLPSNSTVSLKPKPAVALQEHSETRPTVSTETPSSCLKPKLVNHNEPRANSRVGLRVHFKLPEDEEDSVSSEDSSMAVETPDNRLQRDFSLTSLTSLPSSLPPTMTSPVTSLVTSSLTSSVAVPMPFSVASPVTSALTSSVASLMTSSVTSPMMTTVPSLMTSTLTSSLPASVESSLSSLNKEPPPVLAKPKLDPVQLQILHNQVLLEQQQEVAPPPVSEHAPWSPRLHHEPQLGSVSLPNLPTEGPAISTSSSNMSKGGFSYTRPKEFIVAQTLSPTRSLSPTESPVPMLNAMAAQVQQKPAVEFTLPPFPSAANQHTPSPRQFPTRVLQSPSSPSSSLSSPPTVPPALLNSTFAVRPQSPPQASSPTSSSSTPSPIQNPVAFLSSVLPSLPTPAPTNAMGLPKSAPVLPPQGLLKKPPKPHRSVSDDVIQESKETILHDLEKKLRFREDSGHIGQQKLTYEAKAADRLLGPNNPATVINYEEEYKVSSFEQRLMSEIEFRLERTPVEESDDEVKHDEIPTGKCIAPIFDKKLKNFRAMEGVPVTFTCKVVGIPVPKVYWFKDGKQILKKNEHYKRAREGDGTCTLHIQAVTNDDDGNYTVMAANPQGRNSCSGHLIVQTGPIRGRFTPMIHSHRVRSRVQETGEGEPVQERFFRPHFLQAPGDMVGHEGRLCRFDCKVSGVPNPDLMWLRNGKPIFPDIRHRMLVRETGVHSLLIDPLMQSDAGTYTCIATNKAGQNSFSLELSVMEKEVKKVPVFLERLQNVGIAEGTPLRLECRVVGVPPPVIYWKKDNETISPTKERMSMHQDATGYVCLLIQPTRKEDAGWYTVSAKNEAGIVSCTARLDIYAQWHQQIPPPMRKVRPTASRYAALTGQGLDILSAFPSTDSSPILFASSPVEADLESEEL